MAALRFMFYSHDGLGLGHLRRNLAIGGEQRRPVPCDPALPHMADVLDPALMTKVLKRSLGDRARPLDVRVHYLRYKPHTNLVVHYDVRIDGRRHHATAMIASCDLARRARKPQNVALAEMVDGRSPAPMPLSYDPDLEAVIQWFPLDLSLPALAKPPHTLRDSIRRAGLDVGEIADDPQVLAYKPRRRVVLRAGDHVLKIYRHDHEFRRALEGLRVSSGLPSVRTPALEAVVADLRLTVQSALAGASPASPTAVAAAVGELLRRLHGAGARDLRRFEPRDQLQAAAAACGISAVAETAERRVQRLLRELEAGMPRARTLVPSHGDLNASQILEQGGQLALVDFDRMCLAPPAIDLANYAAKLITGSPSELGAALSVLEELLQGYGRRPDDMPWYLAAAILGRSSHPFRYLDDHWPERVEGMVQAAEAALAA